MKNKFRSWKATRLLLLIEPIFEFGVGFVIPEARFVSERVSKRVHVCMSGGHLKLHGMSFFPPKARKYVGMFEFPSDEGTR